MSEESKSSSTNALIDIKFPDSVDHAVKNLTDKPTLSIGQTVSDLWQLVLGGRVAHAVEKQKLKYAKDLESYRESLEAKVNAIPQEKQVAPSLQVVGQALEDSKYCVESESLREMFANLIASSMNSDSADTVHPSFSKIIQQMSPTDANMLKIFRYNRKGGIAIANFIKTDSTEGFSTLIENIPEVIPTSCSHEAAARSIVSLQRFGLISIFGDYHFTDETRYDGFRNISLYQKYLLHAKHNGWKLGMQKHVATLTLLGQDFIRVCLD